MRVENRKKYNREKSVKPKAISLRRSVILINPQSVGQTDKGKKITTDFRDIKE